MSKDAAASFMRRVERLGSGGELSDASLDAVSGGAVPRQPIESTSEDQKYFLKKLETRSKTGDALSDHLHDIAEASSSLGRKEPP